MSHVITCVSDSQIMLCWAKGPANFFPYDKQKLPLMRNFNETGLFCYITSLVEVGSWLSKWIFMPTSQLYSRTFK